MNNPFSPEPVERFELEFFPGSFELGASLLARQAPIEVPPPLELLAPVLPVPLALLRVSPEPEFRGQLSRLFLTAASASLWVQLFGQPKALGLSKKECLVTPEMPVFHWFSECASSLERMFCALLALSCWDFAFFVWAQGRRQFGVCFELERQVFSAMVPILVQKLAEELPLEEDVSSGELSSLADIHAPALLSFLCVLPTGVDWCFSGN